MESGTNLLPGDNLGAAWRVIAPTRENFAWATNARTASRHDRVNGHLLRPRSTQPEQTPERATRPLSWHRTGCRAFPRSTCADPALTSPSTTPRAARPSIARAPVLLVSVVTEGSIGTALANGRILVMCCAFEGPPCIVRLHGRGEVVPGSRPALGETPARCLSLHAAPRARHRRSCRARR
jgi:hypothetical protein